MSRQRRFDVARPTHWVGRGMPAHSSAAPPRRHQRFPHRGGMAAQTLKPCRQFRGRNIPGRGTRAPVRHGQDPRWCRTRPLQIHQSARYKAPGTPRGLSPRRKKLEEVSARSRRSGSQDAADRECLAALTPDTRAGRARDAAIPVRRIRQNLQGPGERKET